MRSPGARIAARPLVGLAMLGAALTACAGTLETIGAGLAYEQAVLPEAQVVLDIPYRSDPDADPQKHRLDLFLPTSPPAGSDAHAGFPTLVFVHGGGWTAGDRAMGAFGIEPIRNLGRFYAARGYGVVVPSYRLQPAVAWPEQIDDVARAVEWVDREIAAHGGDPHAIFLGGHSAGAWLAAWVGLDDDALRTRGLDRTAVCGLVLVSGAGYDLEDEGTYALGADRGYFERLFGRTRSDWASAASIRRHVDPPVPAALLLSAAGEPAKFRRQGDLLFETLVRQAPRSRRVTVEGQDHQRILVSMSLAGDPVSQETLRFLAEQPCPAPRTRP